MRVKLTQTLQIKAPLMPEDGGVFPERRIAAFGTFRPSIMKEPKIRQQIYLITSQQVCAVLPLGWGNPQFGGLKTAQALLKVSPAGRISPQEDADVHKTASTPVGDSETATSPHRHAHPPVYNRRGMLPQPR